MQGKLPFEQKKMRSRKRKRMFWIVVAWISLVVLIICGLSFITSLSTFRITTISVSGNDRVSSDDVRTLVSHDMSSEFLWFFPHSSYFFVPTGKITADILNNFPAVDSVSVHRSGFTALSVDIKEKMPEAWWCTDADCAVLDQFGTAFNMEGRSATDTSMVVFESSTTPSVGQSPLSGGFPQVLIFINALAARGLNPTIAEVKTGEIDIGVASSTDIIIDPTKDLTEALKNLDTILSNPQSPIQKSNIDQVQYIDLRFDGKVFYKNTGTSS